MVQTAKVTRVLADGRAEVAVKRQSACGHDCSKCGGGCSELMVSSTVAVIAANPVRAMPGDMVTVESSTSRVLGAAVIVYLVPFLLFFVGYFAAAALGDLFTYVVTSFQLGVIDGGMARYLMVFAVTQIPLAIVEGLLTVVVFNVLEKYSKTELETLCVL